MPDNGYLGYGKIGQRVARYAKAFGMEVMVWGSENSKKNAMSHGFKTAAPKKISQADILSLHLRLNQTTQGCVTYDDLQHMKKDALIVNISRAGLIEPHALFFSLHSGRPGFATVDVYDSAPVKIGGETLLSLPNVLATPHLGYVEKNSYELYFQITFENIVNFFGGHPINIANPGLNIKI